jgi:hypothetical protein
MKLLRKTREQGKTLLKLGETLIKTKRNLEKLTKGHDELKCSHGDLVQRYKIILIEKINNENALSCIAQFKIDNAMLKVQAKKLELEKLVLLENMICFCFLMKN